MLIVPRSDCLASPGNLVLYELADVERYAALRHTGRGLMAKIVKSHVVDADVPEDGFALARHMVAVERRRRDAARRKDERISGCFITRALNEKRGGGR